MAAALTAAPPPPPQPDLCCCRYRYRYRCRCRRHNRCHCSNCGVCDCTTTPPGAGAAGRCSSFGAGTTLPWDGRCQCPPAVGFPGRRRSPGGRFEASVRGSIYPPRRWCFPAPFSHRRFFRTGRARRRSRKCRCGSSATRKAVGVTNWQCSGPDILTLWQRVLVFPLQHCFLNVRAPLTNWTLAFSCTLMVRSCYATGGEHH